MHWKNLANYDYLGAYSLEGVKEVTLTIKDVKKERVTSNGGASEDCIVARFVETKVGSVVVKPMVLNKTNCKMIQKIYNDPDTDNWVGKKITIFATTTRFARDMVECLRVKDVKPPATPTPAPSPAPEPKPVETVAPVTEEKPVYKCLVCGKEISESLAKGSVAKYGVPLCSKECLDKFVESQQPNSEE